jgi:hypothetical protein
MKFEQLDILPGIAPCPHGALYTVWYTRSNFLDNVLDMF